MKAADYIIGPDADEGATWSSKNKSLDLDSITGRFLAKALADDEAARQRQMAT